MIRARFKRYNIYRVTVRNARDLIEGKFEVAAVDRAAAQEAGDQWAGTRGMTGAKVSVMVVVKQGIAQTMLVVDNGKA